MYKEMVVYKQELIEKLATASGDKRFWQRNYKFHLEKLRIFNTERLIHLLVMLFVGLYMVVFFCFSLLMSNYLLMFLALVTVVLFGVYLVYYFKLENIVQALSRLTPEFEEKIENSGEVKMETFRLPPVVDLVIDKVSEFVADFLAKKR